MNGGGDKSPLRESWPSLDHGYWESALHGFVLATVGHPACPGRSVALCVLGWGCGVLWSEAALENQPPSHIILEPLLLARKTLGPGCPNHRQSPRRDWQTGLSALAGFERPRPAAEPREGAQQPARLKAEHTPFPEP